MQVIDMLGNMALLSVGPDSLTPKTKAIFLKYLNIANREIYGKTAAINPDVVVNETIDVQVGHDEIALDNDIFSVNNIYVNDKYPSLKLKPYMDFIAYKKWRTVNSSDPEIFSFRKNTLLIYPIRPNTQYTLDVFYAPHPEDIRETTAEGDIPCPKVFHDILVDGALYYLFSDEEGFKSTRDKLEAKERKESRLKDLNSYLYSNQNQSFSTYSPI